MIKQSIANFLLIFSCLSLSSCTTIIDRKVDLYLFCNPSYMTDEDFVRQTTKTARYGVTPNLAIGFPPDQCTYKIDDKEFVVNKNSVAKISVDRSIYNVTLNAKSLNRIKKFNENEHKVLDLENDIRANDVAVTFYRFAINAPQENTGFMLADKLYIRRLPSNEIKNLKLDFKITEY